MSYLTISGEVNMADAAWTCGVEVMGKTYTADVLSFTVFGKLYFLIQVR